MQTKCLALPSRESVIPLPLPQVVVRVRECGLPPNTAYRDILDSFARCRAIFREPQAVKRPKLEQGSGSPSKALVLQLNTQFLRNEPHLSAKAPTTIGPKPFPLPLQPRVGASSAANARSQAPPETRPELPRPREDSVITPPLPRLSFTTPPRAKGQSKPQARSSSRPDLPVSTEAGRDVSSSREPESPRTPAVQLGSTAAVPGARPASVDASQPRSTAPVESADPDVVHADPDVVHYLEKLGLPAEVYASKLEAVGLKNGAIMNAMRKSVPETRKDKLEEDIQRLGGVSVAEAMVLVSGLRNSR